MLNLESIKTSDSPIIERIKAEGAWAGASWDNDGFLNAGFKRFQIYSREKTSSYYLVPYNPEWPLFAKKVINELTEALKECDGFVKIEHIGSTAIPNMDAKPIIDLFLVMAVDKDNPEIKSDHQPVVERLLRFGFMKITPWFLDYHDENGTRYSLRFGYENSQVYKSRIEFRDYLRNNPKEHNEYLELKRKLMTTPMLFEDYVFQKCKFMVRIFQILGWTEFDMFHGHVITNFSNFEPTVPVPNMLKLEANHVGH